eukprot:6187428-Pleurochrysis_carterae.AAC.2
MRTIPFESIGSKIRFGIQKRNTKNANSSRSYKQNVAGAKAKSQTLTSKYNYLARHQQRRHVRLVKLVVAAAAVALSVTRSIA